MEKETKEIKRKLENMIALYGRGNRELNKTMLRRKKLFLFQQRMLLPTPPLWA